MVKKLQNKNVQTTQLKLAHQASSLSFRVGALFNKSDIFSSNLRVQKLFSYITRGIVIHMYQSNSKMVKGICQKICSLGFAYFLTGKMKLS